MARAAILTISDLGSQGKREDLSGVAIRRMLGEDGYDVIATAVVADEESLISQILQKKRIISNNSSVSLQIIAN